jgi:hypothetical protein
MKIIQKCHNLPMLVLPIFERPTPETAKSRAKLPFDTLVQVLVAEIQECPQKTQSMDELHHRFQVKRRRLYDVTNILIVLGAAARSNAEEITWLGEDQILPSLLKQKQAMNVMNLQIPLSVLFPRDNCVSFTTLAMAVLMMFPAIGTERLNLRDISAFFSRDTQRYKTTICKLYQITLILGALGIMQRTENPCEVKIIQPYTDLLMDGTLNNNPMALSRLLSRPSWSADIMKDRRREFKEACREYDAGKQ